MQLTWIVAAGKDRFDAIEYIAQQNPQAALNQLAEIEKQTDLLVLHPEIGWAGRITGTRELVISGTPFIAVYRINGKMIQILRLLHGAQKWP